ncbi:MAG: radical SAM protein, partial [Planctomycetaceae bacterium]|nr:radical SAM protein [Planctomycetaceae bacterium]
PLNGTPGYYGAEVFSAIGMQPMIPIADLATTTVAAMVPDDFRIALCDEAIGLVDLEKPADFVAITGKSTQVNRMIELAKAFRERGRTVLIGGPFASLSAETLRPWADILVIGEIEDIAETLFNDLRNGTWKAEYRGNKPDLNDSPIPRWDLYPNDRAMMGCVQTSRGCPFTCEFCDVIQYLGRKQRHKSNRQVISELDYLYQHGYRTAFLADDNFTVYRARTRSLLQSLLDWNRSRSAGHMTFHTQLSIDIAEDTDILEACADAGIFQVFIGIETPNEASLKETHKNQNLKVDLQTQIRVFLRHGISVIAGMIVGFDADGPDIFEQQREFAMASPVPVFTLGALSAPIATPLYDRMREQGRLRSTEGSGAVVHPWISNIIPAQMTVEELQTGIQWLMNSLYHPKHFEHRVLTGIREFEVRHSARYLYTQNRSRNIRRSGTDMALGLTKFSRKGRDEASMVSNILKAAAKKPETRPHVMESLFRYMQIRHMCEDCGIWEPSLALQPSPFSCRVNRKAA